MFQQLLGGTGGVAMTLTNREKKVLHEIREWESRLYSYEANDFQLMYDKYIERSFQQLPENIRQSIFLRFWITGYFMPMLYCKAHKCRWMQKRELF